MWCARCEQDVPGLASPQNRGLVCIRCGGIIPHPKEVSQVGSMAAAPSPHAQFSEPQAPKISEGGELGPQAQPPPSSEGLLLPIAPFLGYDEWEVERALRQIGWRLCPQSARESPQQDNHARVDTPHPLLFQTHWPLPKDTFLPPGTSPPKRYARRLLLYGGIVLLTCGLVLLLWGYLGARPDLPRWGWPCLVLGQAGLVFGMSFSSSRCQRPRTSGGADGHPEGTIPPSPLLWKTR